jgi:hypothetical protein
MLCNTMNPVLPEFVSLTRRLGHDGFEVICSIVYASMRCSVVVCSCLRGLHRVEGRFIVYALLKLFRTSIAVSTCAVVCVRILDMNTP